MNKKPKRGAYDYLVNDPMAYPGNEEALFPGAPPVPSTNRTMDELARSMLPVNIGPKPPEPPKQSESPRPWVVQVIFWLLLGFAIGLLLGRTGDEQIKPTAMPSTWFGGTPGGQP